MNVPRIGLGTWQLEGEACVRAVREALDLGYRHVDTAMAYHNEVEVGRGLRESGVPREAVFLVTKIGPGHLSRRGCTRALYDSLARLRTDYVDLVLVHWPSDECPLAETLHALDDLRQAGCTRHLGVANFPSALLRDALALAPIANVQVELHPFLSQQPILQVCREHDLSLTAYSPLARGHVRRDPELGRIAAKHRASPAQVALRWLLDQGRVAVIPRAASWRHQVENLQALDLRLDSDDHAAIEALPKDLRLSDQDPRTPSGAPPRSGKS